MSRSRDGSVRTDFGTGIRKGRPPGVLPRPASGTRPSRAGVEPPEKAPTTPSWTYPMTLEQESIWLDDQHGDGPSHHLESFALELRGHVDRQAAALAVARIVARHEALRSRFVLDGGQLFQVVLPARNVPEMAHHTCSPEQAEAKLRELARRPIDLAASPMRATLLEMSPEAMILCVQFHRIVADDRAMRTFAREFAEHYRACVEHRPLRSAPPPMQPGAYAIRQRSTPRDPAALTYWLGNLRGLSPGTATTIPPTLAPGTPPHSDRVAFALDAALVESLRAACRRLHTTPLVLLAATTALLLHAAGGARDVIVGTPVSYRGAADRDQMIAPLTRLLPLRLRLAPGQSYAALVRQTKRKVHEALVHRNVTQHDLVRLVRRSRSGALRLCRTLIVVDEPEQPRIDLPGVTARRLRVGPGPLGADLCFTFVVDGGEHLGFLDYAAHLFSATTARHLAETFRTLLTSSLGDLRGGGRQPGDTVRADT
ncbi:condensation domain-containing protein [Microbispora sp. NPDC004025]